MIDISRRIAQPNHAGVFMTLGGTHIEGCAKAAARSAWARAHIAFKVASYAALREAYTHLLKYGVEIQRAADHVCQRSIYVADAAAPW